MIGPPETDSVLQKRHYLNVAHIFPSLLVEVTLSSAHWLGGAHRHLADSVNVPTQHAEDARADGHFACPFRAA